MKDKTTSTVAGVDLKKLSRVELLRLMLQLSEENEALQQKNATLESRLGQRTIDVQEAGSIAEASLKVSDVFATAQDAADRYLENIARLNEETQQRCDALLAKTQSDCAAMEAESTKRITQQKALLEEWTARYEAAERNLNTSLARVGGNGGATTVPEAACASGVREAATAGNGAVSADEAHESAADDGGYAHANGKLARETLAGGTPSADPSAAATEGAAAQLRRVWRG